MLRIRIVSTAAATAIALALAAGGAAAQTASTDQAGKPLSLLQLITQPSTATPAVSASSAATAAKRPKLKRVASRTHNKTAAAHDADPPADAAQSTASADAWLAASAPTATAVPTAAPVDPQSSNAQPANEPLPSAVQIGGQTVQVAAADQANEIDLAADNTPPVAPPMEFTEPPGDRADASSDRSNVMAMADAMAKAAAARAASVAPAAADASQNVSDQNASPAENAGAQNADAQNLSAVGSASWIAQVLAALGGAIAAGVVAWFLIGAGPVRTYS
jgi:hypothetical protein